MNNKQEYLDANGTEKRSQRVDRIAKQVERIMLHISYRKKQLGTKTPLHLAIGQERVAALVSIVRGVGDPLILTHRNLHFNLAACLVSCPSEMPRIINTATGIDSCGEHAEEGSMNLISSVDSSVHYTSSILANGLPVGLGVLSGLLRSGKFPPIAAWLQVGDGSLEEGDFYESVVVATSFRLPAIFVIEDNGWSLGTSKAERRCEIDIERLAQAFNVRHIQIEHKVTTSSALLELDKARQIAVEEKIPVIAVFRVDIPEITSSSQDRKQFYHHGYV